jgi:quercetin dioxygenase-like cupin family protein
MPIIDTNTLDTGEPLPGWHDRYFSAEGMSFAYYDVDANAAIHEHFHPEEEVWHVIEGTLEIAIDGRTFVAGPGMAAIIPSNTRHCINAKTNAKVIIANQPARQRVVRHR